MTVVNTATVAPSEAAELEALVVGGERTISTRR